MNKFLMSDFKEKYDVDNDYQIISYMRELL